MGKSKRNNKTKEKCSIQSQNNISTKQIEIAIINAHDKINEKNNIEMQGIIQWTKKVLQILAIILVILLVSLVLAFVNPIFENIKNGKVFELVNVFLICYVIIGMFFIEHINKINSEIDKINDISTITNIATLLLSIIALIIAIIALWAQIGL